MRALLFIISSPTLYFDRLVLAAVIYTIDIVALASACFIVKLNTTLVIITVSIIVTGFIVFMALTYMGGRMIRSLGDDSDEENGSANNAYSDDGPACPETAASDDGETTAKSDNELSHQSATESETTAKPDAPAIAKDTLTT